MTGIPQLESLYEDYDRCRRENMAAWELKKLMKCSMDQMVRELLERYKVAMTREMKAAIQDLRDVQPAIDDSVRTIIRNMKRDRYEKTLMTDGGISMRMMANDGRIDELLRSYKRMIAKESSDPAMSEKGIGQNMMVTLLRDALAENCLYPDYGKLAVMYDANGPHYSILLAHALELICDDVDNDIIMNVAQFALDHACDSQYPGEQNMKTVIEIIQTTLCHLVHKEPRGRYLVDELQKRKLWPPEVIGKAL